MNLLDTIDSDRTKQTSNTELSKQHGISVVGAHGLDSYKNYFIVSQVHTQ